MDLEQLEPLVNGVDQSDLACQQVHTANAAAGDAVRASRHFIVDVAGGEHGQLLLFQNRLREPPRDFPLAIDPALSLNLIHSKSLRGKANGRNGYLQYA